MTRVKELTETRKKNIKTEAEWIDKPHEKTIPRAVLQLLKKHRASLVAQWLRICLPMQGTRVRALVWEDPTCRGATRPVSHNY